MPSSHGYPHGIDHGGVAKKSVARGDLEDGADDANKEEEDENDLFAAIEEEQHRHDKHDCVVKPHEARAAPILLQ